MLVHASQIEGAYIDLETNKCMRMIMECADIANKYIDAQAPWALVKDDPAAAQVVCTNALNALRILMIFLAPVLPVLTQKLADFLGIQPQNWSQLSENIGACARAIKNFSFNKLVLINPKPIFPNDKILATSVGAKDIISQSKKFDKIEKKNLQRVNIYLQL